MNQKEFKKVFSASDVVIPAFQEGKLLIYLVKLKADHLKGQWALPGALVRDNENLDQTTKRIYQEATGQNPLLYEQLYTFSDPKRDSRSRSISTAYLTFPRNNKNFNPCAKYAQGKWWDYQKIPKLAYDHNQILKEAYQRIASKIHYSTMSFFLIETAFTLSDLQILFQYFQKEPIDKRNFRKKILSMDLIEETGDVCTGKKYRPAKLYRTKNNELLTFKMYF